MMSDRIGHWCSVRLQNIIRLVLSVVGEDDFFCRFNNNKQQSFIFIVRWVSSPRPACNQVCSGECSAVVICSEEVENIDDEPAFRKH